MKPLIFVLNNFGLPSGAELEDVLWSWRNDHRVIWAGRLLVLVTAGCSVAASLWLSLWCLFTIPTVLLGWVAGSVCYSWEQLRWWNKLLCSVLSSAVLAWLCSLSFGLVDGVLGLLVLVAVLSVCRNPKPAVTDEPS